MWMGFSRAFLGRKGWRDHLSRPWAVLCTFDTGYHGLFGSEIGFTNKSAYANTALWLLLYLDHELSRMGPILRGCTSQQSQRGCVRLSIASSSHSLPKVGSTVFDF